MIFDKKSHTWKSYTTNKALASTKNFQIIDKKYFVIAVLDINSKTFMMQVAI